MKENLVIYENKNGTIELRADIKKDTIWATQDQVAKLFGVKKSAISKHAKNIFESCELIKEATVSKMEIVQMESGRSIKRLLDFYNLDVIIAVGYRVNSKKATQFRIWATNILRDYLKRGYSIDRSKLTESRGSLEGLREALALIESDKFEGRLKGKLTLKLTKELKISKSSKDD